MNIIKEFGCFIVVDDGIPGSKYGVYYKENGLLSQSILIGSGMERNKAFLVAKSCDIATKSFKDILIESNLIK